MNRPDNTEELKRVFGTCDRCGTEVRADHENNVLVLKAVNYKWERETYHVDYLVCSDCRRNFEKWINQRS